MSIRVAPGAPGGPPLLVDHRGPLVHTEARTSVGDVDRAVGAGLTCAEAVEHHHIRHAFVKHGGNLGTDGSVAFLFKHCGQLVFAPGTDENRLMEVSLDAGAEDIVDNDDGSLEVITGPHQFVTVREALVNAGLKPDFAEVTMKPTTEVVLSGEDGLRMQKLLDDLESLDDVQDVYTNAVIDGV